MELEIQSQDWIKDVTFKGLPILIAGPCSAESEKQLLRTAQELDKSRVNVFRAGVWKPRTKPGTFEGVGKIGLEWLKKVKKETGFLVSTEVANAEHVKLALEYDIDILWIGARSTVSPFIVQEIADTLKKTDKIVLVKNPINPDLELWIGALERLYAAGIKKLGAIHRGFSTYKKTKYRNKPKWQIVVGLKNRLPNIPVICDPSHICGNRENIYEVSQKAFNLEFSGLMIESHYMPDKAWSDAKQQITPNRLKEIIKDLTLRKHDEKNDLYRNKLNHYREEIDEIDGHLIEMLSDRMKVVEKIGKLKAENNVAVLQSSRWQSILNSVATSADQMKLKKEFVEYIFKAIHEESINVQSKIIN